ncbi:hypothetical protein [Pseudoflavonifractor phocaeensis]|uniref:hypothetical protein n=1 Tax=Pseudoflavonifractor phocaeensis TaxID=1870988 RepID=UPI00195A5878|nr:hypothetical protein [Pseudoflavonifractor phocaeensis]MBM6888023.1 hypothetical protein [Pseudoflavonifractor phocaeensis]
MIGLYGIGLGAPVQYWKPVAANRVAMVSRAQPKATDQPVAPVSAAPTVSRNQPSAVQLSGFQYQPGTDPVELSVRSRIQYLSPEELEAEIAKSKSTQEVMAEGECQTCKGRKYQDGSDDPGVSFKTPTNVVPELAASAVRGHEQEHVVREQAEARREGREVVSQSVTYHTAICPECGKVYVSGGTTRTSTRAVQEQPDAGAELEGRVPFSAVA